MPGPTLTRTGASALETGGLHPFFECRVSRLRPYGKDAIVLEGISCCLKRLLAIKRMVPITIGVVGSLVEIKDYGVVPMPGLRPFPNNDGHVIDPHLDTRVTHCIVSQAVQRSSTPPAPPITS